MTIREKVALAISRTGIPVIEAYSMADAAITAFLEAAAEPDEDDGISWHMRPDEVTEEMVEGACKTHKVGKPMKDGMGECPYFIGRRKTYRAMQAASPKFVWDGE